MVCNMCLPDRVQSAVVQTPSTRDQDTQEVTVPESKWVISKWGNNAEKAMFTKALLNNLV